MRRTSRLEAGKHMTWYHPKYYAELKRIRKQEELKRASEQAKREGGPASCQAGNEPRSVQAQLVRKPKRAR
jgi:hypothetical protein